MASDPIAAITNAAKPLPPISNPTFAHHFDDLAEYKVVLLGDGSHGTSEFYSARAEITKRLVREHGFSVIALEADWPDAEVIDRYVRQRPTLATKMGTLESRPQPNAFRRFPTWMWRNREFQDLAHWMRDYNSSLPFEKRAGFYGLDLYSMETSICAVIDYLDHVDPQQAKEARRRYGCLQPWVEEPSMYGMSFLRGGTNCEKRVTKMLQDLLAHRVQYIQHFADGEEFRSSEQNAYLIRDAEQYYKVMLFSSSKSWSLRDTHMVSTLKRVLRDKPPGTKAIVWAHNSHCGDARYTHMGPRSQVNVGQLVREDFGRENVAIVGCDTHTGTVAAADEWDANMRIMKVNPSRRDSWEYLAHCTGISRFVLDLRPEVASPLLRSVLSTERQRLMRFIGVIYRPDTERESHYSRTALENQFDKYVWFETTEAVKALEAVQPSTPLNEAETYPFGL
ncbi:uncharacterized protein CDV56_103857 [Aspergillus thermomutatus]|uniref:Erythromycin esterase n=1 Tax=Aspergillus thermomutatus TaxID=41047 RepID=A0A397G2A9_ASPTH|nr:uncharacterized protein CDV56_103857 [Aspergillus thermomutatus]RHZ45095.1 hypothetical protein CDV56_103857 [Aspergillus thermomutatus]